MPEDLEALAAIRELAKEYCFVGLTFSDCGCHRLELWVGGSKIAEEDKDLKTCVDNLRKKIEEKRKEQ